MNKYITLLILLTTTLLKAQCSLSFLELESMCTLNLSKIDTILIKKGYTLRNNVSYNLVSLKSYFCGNLNERGKNNQLQITAPKNYPVILTYETANEQYQEEFILKLNANHYKFIKDEENNIGGQLTKRHFYSNGKTTVVIYKYYFEGVTIFAHSISEGKI